MSTDSANVFEAALSLPFEDRFELANQLWESVKPPGVWNIDDPSFAAELKRRVERIDAGVSSADDWEVVRDRIRNKLKESRSS
jgi:putative addiction module component (TIGR02574 family)